MIKLVRALVPILAIVLGGCGAPAGSPEPSATPVSSVVAAASVAPSPAPMTSEPILTAEPEPVDVDSGPVQVTYSSALAMRVAIDGRTVRAAPSASGEPVGVANRGDVFVVRNWPIEADGDTWYLGYRAVVGQGSLPELSAEPDTGDSLTGWIAAGPAANPNLVSLPARCPASVELQNVVAMMDSERLACFGSTQIRVTGTYGCGGCGGVDPGDYQPRWLAAPEYPDFAIPLHFPPSGQEAPAPASIVNLVGHFDDPAASTCSIQEPDDDGELRPIGPELSVDWCRRRFVVDSYEIVGIDPTFEGG